MRGEIPEAMVYRSASQGFLASHNGTKWIGPDARNDVRLLTVNTGPQPLRCGGWFVVLYVWNIIKSCRFEERTLRGEIPEA